MKLKILLACVLALTAAAPAVGQVRSAQTFAGSGTITTAGVSQIALNGHASRSWLICENPITATEPLFVNFGPNNPASTAGGSIELAPGGSLAFVSGVVPTGQVNVTAATVGHRFICTSGA